jgi:hypothetical protein
VLLAAPTLRATIDSVPVIRHSRHGKLFGPHLCTIRLHRFDDEAFTAIAAGIKSSTTFTPLEAGHLFAFFGLSFLRCNPFV